MVHKCDVPRAVPQGRAEVAEAGTEVEEEQQVEEDDVVNHVKARLETGRHMEQHPWQQEEPRRRHEE